MNLNKPLDPDLCTECHSSFSKLLAPKPVCATCWAHMLLVAVKHVYVGLITPELELKLFNKYRDVAVEFWLSENLGNNNLLVGE